MGALRRSLDRLAPHFAQGGRLQRYGALFEMIDTLLYTPADRTRVAPHVRDGADLKRVMILVVLAFGLISVDPARILLGIALVYALSGPVQASYRRLKKPPSV